MYSYSAQFPIIFRVERGCAALASQSLLEKQLAFNRIIVASGREASAAVADTVAASLGSAAAARFLVADNAQATAQKLADEALASRADLLVGVGGGRVVDVVKRAGHLARVNVLVVPTIVANDGLMSPIAVLSRPDGRTESLPGAMPIGILADLDVLLQAPHHYVAAAACDLMSNLSAAVDWRYSAETTGERIIDPALLLATTAAEAVMRFSPFDDDGAFVEQVVRSQILSGVAMALAGTSRPCSGSEHLISHAIEALGLAPGKLHGSLVGSISLFTLWLSGSLREDQREFIQRMGVPAVFTEFGPQIEARLHDVFALSREMRPGRRTILDRFNDDELVDRVKTFSLEQPSA